MAISSLVPSARWPPCASPGPTVLPSAAPVGKRGTELLYRAGDLKKWARNRPRAATGITDLD
ncbi:hypothetical protein ACWCXX_36405 [Streptomyces sp. NPDC001732]